MRTLEKNLILKKGASKHKSNSSRHVESHATLLNGHDVYDNMLAFWRKTTHFATKTANWMGSYDEARTVGVAITNKMCRFIFLKKIQADNAEKWSVRVEQL